jgi:radical SAM superfamily enzyme YgiQ (UPF0313 family)
MQRFGLEVLGGFIVGFDNDSPSIFHRQINFIQQSGIVTAMVGLLNPLKGTKLYERLHEEGRLLGEFKGDNTDFSINFFPKMGCQTLLEGYRDLVTNIYSPCLFYRRLITFLSNYRPVRKEVCPPHSSYIKAFFRSSWDLGIISDGRLYYWKTLIWTILRRPQLFSLCMRRAVYGYHFRKVFQAQISKSEDLTEHVNPISMKEIKPVIQVFEREESIRETFGAEETCGLKEADSDHARGT